MKEASKEGQKEQEIRNVLEESFGNVEQEQEGLCVCVWTGWNVVAG
jgi:hypothetical protein